VKPLAIAVLVLLGSAAGAAGKPPQDAMTVERAAHTATLLADGRVLVAGGIRGGEAALASAELFDPATGRFEATAPMATPRSGHTATLLRDGRVLVAGGWDDERLQRTTELFDPRTGTFSAGADLSAPRGGHTATRLRDGTVLLVGGRSGRAAVRSADLFDPATGRMRAAGRLAEAREAHTATLLGDGRVLVVGGSSAAGVHASAEIYDPRAGAFARAGAMAVPRHKHAAALLPDGSVLVVGGSDARDWRGRHRSAERWRPSTRSFAPARPMRAARFKLGASVVALPGGRVVVTGGSPLVEVFTRGRFVTASLRLDAPRFSSTATRLRDGRVLVAGGYDGSISPTALLWLYRPD
jgi:hypothetical protein